MQFSDTVTKQGIIQDIDFLTGVDINAYPLAHRVRNVNERYRQVLSVIWEAYGGWKWQDDNGNANPYGEKDLASGTGTYDLPTGTLRISMVEMLNSGNTYEQLVPMTEKEFQAYGGEAAFPSSGVPRFYMPYEDKVRLLPTPNFSKTNGLRVYIDRDISSFAASDTTKVPGFASPFHRALSVGASLDYAMARGLDSKEAKLEKQWLTYLSDIARFYSKRFQDRYPHKIGRGVDIVNQNR